MNASTQSPTTVVMVHRLHLFPRWRIIFSSLHITFLLLNTNAKSQFAQNFHLYSFCFGFYVSVNVYIFTCYPCRIRLTIVWIKKNLQKWRKTINNVVGKHALKKKRESQMKHSAIRQRRRAKKRRTNRVRDKSVRLRSTNWTLTLHPQQTIQ